MTERCAIADEDATSLEGFDSRGAHVGTARWEFSSGRWEVRANNRNSDSGLWEVCPGNSLWVVASERQARELLTQAGATIIMADSGLK